MKLSEKTAAVLGLVLGSTVLSALSFFQRLALEIPNFDLHSFVTPAATGGVLGACIGFLIARFYARTEEIEQLLQGRIEEVARFEKEKELALLEQERITHEILNQSKLVDTLLETLPAPVFFKDPEGRYQGCNRAFEELIGISSQDLRGKTPHDLYDEESANLFDETDRKIALKGGEEIYEASIITRCGSRRDVQVTKTAYRQSDGTLGGMIGVILDVTESKKNQKVLAETAERLDLALKGADMGFWDWNILTGEVIYSDRFVQMLGYEPSEVSNDLIWWQKLIHPQDLPYVRKKIKDHMKTGMPSLKVDYRVRNKSGEWLWMRTSGKVVEWNGHNRATRAAGTQIDITGVRQAREALENQISLMQSLLASIPNPVFFTDAERRYLGVNRAYEEFTGLKNEDIQGKNAKEVWGEQKGEQFFETDQRVLTHKETVIYEYRDEYADGVERDCIISKAPFFRTDGSVNGLIGIITDISGHKRVKDALAESEEKYRTVVEYSGQMIAITQDGKPVFVNRKAVELTGYSEDHLMAHGLTVFVHPDDLERETDFIQDSFIESNTIPFSQYRIVTKDGDIRWCEENTVLINWKSKPATLHFITDTTERKKAEEILLGGERLNAIADLASGVAHNFNNMLQIIMGGAGLALMDLDSGATEKVRTQLRQIVESARFGAGAVRRLEDFANIRHKTRVGAEDVFDVSELVLRAIDMTELWWKTEPEKEGYKIVVNTDLQPELIAKVQEDDLFEVLLNIIKNATEAMPLGGQIKLSSRLDDDQVLIVIEDSGIGISQDNLAKIFEPFWTTKGFKATGMGLSSSLGVLKRYKGDISIQSELGKGTAVTISLPATPAVPFQEQTPVQPISPRKPLNILVVDDMEMLLDLLHEGLSEFGHRVYTASSGQQALELFKENKIDIVISDLGMPNISGWEVGKEIKRMCETRGIPKVGFILLTGWGNQQEEEEKIIEAGVDEVVVKPVDLGNLLTVIDKIAFSESSNNIQ